MEFAPVLTKQDFVRRYQAGEFGNRAPTWSCSEWLQMGLVRRLKSKPDKKYHLRNKVAGGVTHYNLSYHQMIGWLNEIRGVERDNWYISEMAPHNKNLLQGEVRRDTNHYGLYYSMVKDLPMREALAKESFNANGIGATMLLRSVMNPKSYDWLQVLFDRYPDHIIEFSSFATEWGTLPGYNTVIWEVRNY